jgi:predicted DNA-binding transcriptional regulator
LALGLQQNQILLYNLSMEITTIRVRRQSAKRLKLLAAMQEDTMMNVLDRLIEAELARMQERGKSEPPYAGDTRVQD